MIRRCLGCRTPIHSGSRCPTCRAEQKAPYSDPEYQRLRPIVLLRDGYTCQIKRKGCTEIATTVDHIDARTKDRTPAAEDLQAACLPCNSGKRDR